MTTRVLFLCTGNSARSQMAEALLRSITNGKVEAYSAGTEPKALHPLAVKAMAEVGIDISRQRAKPLDEYMARDFDFTISLCARAAQECPAWPRSREQIRWSFDDPSEAKGSLEERLAAFRRIRMEIRQRLGLFVLANKLAVEVRIT